MPFILAQSCFLCGDMSSLAICAPCLADLPYHHNACLACGNLEEEGVCYHCQQELPPYTHTQALFSYVYPINKMIHAAKFYHNLVILNLLGQLMAQHLRYDEQPEVLIPVPLHPQRLRQRGYNQSTELAKCISKHTGIPFDYKVCHRIKNTVSQRSLSAPQRHSNLQGAFILKPLKEKWQHVVLIDDVMTTGATVKEMAIVFKEAGVRRVDVWCCAHR